MTAATSEAGDVYAAAVTYLLGNGWRRQELGSGWWWKDGCEEEATLGSPDPTAASTRRDSQLS